MEDPQRRREGAVLCPLGLRRRRLQHRLLEFGRPHFRASVIGKTNWENEGILANARGRKEPLIRPATAGEDACRGPPSPLGEGKSPIWRRLYPAMWL